MNSPLSPSVLSRRTLLKGLAVAGVAGLVPRHLAAQPAAAATSLLDYLAAHQRADGGYAFADQERSHLTPTFAVIGAYKLGDSTTVTSFFNLVRVHNEGAAFSFLAGASGWQYRPGRPRPSRDWTRYSGLVPVLKGA